VNRKSPALNFASIIARLVVPATVSLHPYWAGAAPDLRRSQSLRCESAPVFDQGRAYRTTARNHVDGRSGLRVDQLEGLRHCVGIYSSVAEDENHVRLVTALKSGRLSGECGLGMRIGCERPVANSKLLLERNLFSKIAKLTKRTEGALRQKAKMLGIGLGHRR